MARRLLAAANLPTDDISYESLVMYVMTVDGAVVACGAIESHGEVALLRSLLVLRKFRGAIVAPRLIRKLVDVARYRAARCILVLTSRVSEPVLRRYGFLPGSRRDFDRVMRDARGWQLSRGSDAVLFVRQL